MKIRLTRPQAFIAFASIVGFILLGAGGGPLGVSAQQHNTDYQISSGTSFLSIIGSVLLAYCILAVVPKNNPFVISKRVPLWRRLIALYIDFVVGILSVTPILTMPIIIVEYFYEGVFKWSFERDFMRSTDFIITISCVILLMIWMFVSFPS